MVNEINNQEDKLSQIEEINIFDIIEIIRKGLKSLFAFTFLISMLSLIYSLTLEDIYQSDSVLIARDSGDKNSLSQISGLASIAGIGIPSSSNSLTEVNEIISSREFTKHLLTFDNILPSIMAAESYNENTGKIVFRADYYDHKDKIWIRKVSAGKESKPSYLEAHRVFMTLLKIDEDNTTGILNLSIEHISPVFAKELLQLVISEVNTLLRKRDIESSIQALEFLKVELNQTAFVEIKSSINELIEVQLEKQMMAKIYEDYSLIILEPPFVPDEKSGPKRSLIVLFSTFLGFFLGIFYVLIRHFLLVSRNSG